MCGVKYELLSHHQHVPLLVVVKHGHLVHGGDFFDL